MTRISVLFLIMLVFNSATALTQPSASDTSPKTARQVVEGFLKYVRSGLHPEQAGDYMADTVLAHQLTAEKPTTVRRTPANYAAHVTDFLTLFGEFKLEVTELLADGDKVYVRWKQTGRHLAEVDGYAPTGLPLIELTSVVYRIEQEKIVEYWLQTDRLGFEQQLKQQAMSKK
ncbi:hypothetical protein GCM10027577_07450 [Spirosoma fluminis]